MIKDIALDISAIYQKYILLGGRPDPESFGIWLIRQAPHWKEEVDLEPTKLPPLDPVFVSARKTTFPQAELPEQMPSSTKVPIVSPKLPEEAAGIILHRLSRFLRFEMKSVLQDFGLLHPEDFGVLATIWYRPGIPKMELIKQNLLELPTGSEMIKRFHKQEWILEKFDPKDKRSKQLWLTEKGAKNLFHIVQQMKLKTALMAPLSNDEQSTLLHLLTKLDGFHSQRLDLIAMETLLMEGRLKS